MCNELLTKSPTAAVTGPRDPADWHWVWVDLSADRTHRQPTDSCWFVWLVWSVLDDRHFHNVCTLTCARASALGHYDICRLMPHMPANCTKRPPNSCKHTMWPPAKYCTYTGILCVWWLNLQFLVNQIFYNRTSLVCTYRLIYIRVHIFIWLSVYTSIVM